MFRVVLDLSYYLSNHKRKARVFIKENIKTVADLQKRITDIFSLKNFDLYAADGQHFLPPQEDIRVLSNDEIVSVISKDKNELVEEMVDDIDLPPVASSKTKKKLKRSLEIIAEEDTDHSTPKKKKNQVDYSSSPEEESPKKKKKKKDSKKRNNTEDISQDSSVQTKEKSEDITSQMKEHRSSGKHKHDKNLKMDTLLPTLKSHINSCDKSGHYLSSSSTSVRLSHHVDTPIKNIRNAKPIPTITNEVIKKKSVNIVKIDIIKHHGEVQINENNENSNTETLPSSTPNNNFVKNVVNYIEKEKTLSPEKNLFAKNVEPTSNCNTSMESEDYQLQNESVHIKQSDCSFISQNNSGHSQNQSKININTDNSMEEPSQHSQKSFSTVDFQNTLKVDVHEQRITDTENKTDLLDLSMDNVSTKSPFSSISYYEDNKSGRSEEKSDILPSNSLNLTNNFRDPKSLGTLERTANLSKTSKSSSFVSKNSPFAFLNNLNDINSVSVLKDSDDQQNSVNGAQNSEINKSPNKSMLSSMSDYEPRASISSCKPNDESVFEKPEKSVALDVSCSDVVAYIPSTSLMNDSKDVSMECDTPHTLNITSTSSLISDSKKSETPIETKNFFFMKRKLSGVAACLEQLKDSDEVSPFINDFVTRRKRKRVRHRPSKNSKDRANSSASDTSFVDPYIPKPLNVSACPKIHVKFDDDNNESYTDDNKTAKIEEGPKALFSEDAILKSKMMLDVEPKVGDIIAFKVLTLKECAPVISQYIVGRVLEISEEKVVEFEILEGQCEDDSEIELNSITKKYPWQKLIAPRHIFP